MTQKITETAEKPTLVFLGTTDDGNARIANRLVLKDEGITSLQKASAAHQFNSLTLRNGVTVMSEQQLLDRIKQLDGKGFEHSTHQLQKALHAIDPVEYPLPAAAVVTKIGAQSQQPAA